MLHAGWMLLLLTHVGGDRSYGSRVNLNRSFRYRCYSLLIRVNGRKKSTEHTRACYIESPIPMLGVNGCAPRVAGAIEFIEHRPGQGEMGVHV